MESNGKRVAIVAGLRTPFAKQWSAYREVSALDLANIVVSEMLQRVELDPKEIQQVVYGQVVPSVEAPNIAREIVLATGMPKSIEAYSVSRACATSYQSAVNVAESIMAGAIDTGVAGGADSASNVPITVSKRLAEALMAATKARSIGPCPRPSKSSRQAFPWATAPRRWRRKTTSVGRPRTSSRTEATHSPPRHGRKASSMTR
jgi:acetyl-CoA acyltransferase